MRNKRKRRIAVFDASTDECDATAAAVREYYGEDTVQVDKFTNMKKFVEAFDLLDYIGDGFDVVFLALDGMLGVEAGRNIREINLRFPLFCVSRNYDYGMESHRLYAMNYLIKPVSAMNVGESEQRIQWEIISNEQFRKSVEASRIKQPGTSPA